MYPPPSTIKKKFKKENVKLKKKKYNSYKIQFSYLKSIVQWFLIHSSCASITFRMFSSPPKEASHLQPEDHWGAKKKEASYLLEITSHFLPTQP
jgi:hypothetical protein